MNTSLIQSLINDSDYFYDQNRYTRGCGDLRSITITFQYNRNVCLEFDKYPELISIAEQLIKYVQESEPIKQHTIKQKILTVLETVK